MAYLSSCGFPPVLSSLYPSILYRTFSSSQPLCFFPFLYLVLLPLGRDNIQKKQRKQWWNRERCTSLATPSVPLFVRVLISSFHCLGSLTFFHFLLSGWFLLSLLLISFLAPHAHAFCLSFIFMFFPFPSFSSVPCSTMWSEPLQWIISQLTHGGQPKPPVQT